MKKKILKIQLIVSGENISIGGNVALLKCVGCGFETFTLDLQSDTDMVYQGIVSLTDLKKKDYSLPRSQQKNSIIMTVKFPETWKSG